MTHNRFENLSVDDDKAGPGPGPSTNNVDRKAKKKLREIEKLEQKSVKTDDELQKIKEKPYWEVVLNPNKDDNIQVSLQKMLNTHKNIIIHQTKEDLTNSQYFDGTCPCCMDEMDNVKQVQISDCEHHMCHKCLLRILDTPDLKSCPLCRTRITGITIQKDSLTTAFSKKVTQKQSISKWITYEWTVLSKT